MAAENDGNDFQVLRTIWSRKTGWYMKLRGLRAKTLYPRRSEFYVENIKP